MILKRNSMYIIEDGYLIPRSRFNDETPKYAIVEILTGDNSHFVVSHKTFTQKDFKRVLNLSAKERIEIL